MYTVVHPLVRDILSNVILEILLAGGPTLPIATAQAGPRNSPWPAKKSTVQLTQKNTSQHVEQVDEQWCKKMVCTLSLTLAVTAVDVSLLALAVVAVAVGALDDAGRAAGLVAVAVAAGGRRLVDEVHGHEGRHHQEHVHGPHLGASEFVGLRFTLRIISFSSR